jgi:hypothetical protein
LGNFGLLLGKVDFLNIWYGEIDLSLLLRRRRKNPVNNYITGKLLKNFT